jgi:GNAT superfamily N-acetyltransferase
MSTVSIRPAARADLPRVNEQYQAINFLPSDLDTEYIAIAEWKGTPCGIGRLVRMEGGHEELGGMYVLDGFRQKGIARSIVSHLLEQHNEQARLWCIPFRHLSGFYESFGFVPVGPDHPDIPAAVAKKMNWCDTHQEQQTSLLLMP